MRKQLFIAFLAFVYIWSWSIFNVVKADDKIIITTGHVVSETIKGTDIDHEAILKAELDTIAYTLVLNMTYVLEKHLPHILEKVYADIRLKADEEYKCKLLEGGSYACGGNNQ